MTRHCMLRGKQSVMIKIYVDQNLLGQKWGILKKSYSTFFDFTSSLYKTLLLNSIISSLISKKSPLDFASLWVYPYIIKLYLIPSKFSLSYLIFFHSLLSQQWRILRPHLIKFDCFKLNKHQTPQLGTLSRFLKTPHPTSHPYESTLTS